MGKAIPTVEGWHSQHMVFAMDSALESASQRMKK